MLLLWTDRTYCRLLPGQLNVLRRFRGSSRRCSHGGSGSSGSGGGGAGGGPAGYGECPDTVRKELVPEGKVLEERMVGVRCAHGEVVYYPIAELDVVVGDKKVVVRAGVSDRLPVQLLLGRDVPELFSLLATSQYTSNSVASNSAKLSSPTEEQPIVAVTTRVQARSDSKALEPVVEEIGQLEDEPTVPNELGPNFADELFEGGHERVRQTRAQKRTDRRRIAAEKAATHEHGSQWAALEMTPEELKDAQQEDTTLAAARMVADGNPNLSEGEGFYYAQGILYRKWEPKGPENKMGPVHQLVLPAQCRDAALAIAHEIPLGGHLGKTKTAQRLLRRFYWPTLYADVAKFCRSCKACQLDSARRVGKAPLIPLPIISEPFRRIAMDIVGPLPRTTSGKRFILVVCDYATRYPEAVALSSTDAEHVAEELVRIFSRVGIPEEILTDQGPNFMSQLLAEIYAFLRIKPICISPYHPQTDGLVERFNQTLNAMVRKMSISESRNWDKLLPYVLFAYREVPQASTGFSPFELLYGREVRGPLDVLRETWEQPTLTDKDVISHVLEMRERLSQMTEIVQENLSRAQHVQKRWYDRTARARQFNPGDRVLVLLPTSTHKLRAQWQGPFTITEKKGEVNYVVDMGERRRRLRTFHVNMLRRWYDSKSISASLYTDDVMEEDPDDIIWWGDGENLPPLINTQLTNDQRQEMERIVSDFKDVFDTKPGRTSLAEHRIETGLAKPVRQPPYRLPHAYRETVQKELAEMERDGVIEPSTSEWASPIVLVPKKDGSLRMCVDYRRLNSVSEADAYPMPRIDDLIDRLGDAKYITTLDLTRGYWQVPVAPPSRTRTAFTTPFGLYQFTVMPFGLQGAPATFQRMMDVLLKGIRDYAEAYLDDLVIFSRTWEEHCQHLKSVLSRLREAGLTAKPAKCQLGMRQCVYLGHLVGNGEVRPEERNLDAIEKFPRPVTKKKYDRS